MSQEKLRFQDIEVMSTNQSLIDRKVLFETSLTGRADQLLASIP